MNISNKVLILGAQTVSLIFAPLYLPVVAFIVLFFFSYMSYMPWTYNLQIIFMVYCFTVLLPWVGIFLYRKINGWTRHQLGKHLPALPKHHRNFCLHNGRVQNSIGQQLHGLVGRVDCFSAKGRKARHQHLFHGFLFHRHRPLRKNLL